MTKKYVYDLIRVCSSPEKIQNSKYPSDRKTLALYFIFTLLFYFLINISIALIDNWIHLPKVQFGIKDLSIFKVVILAPIVEEVCFRAILKNDKFSISIFIVGILYLFLLKLILIKNEHIIFILLFCYLVFNTLLKALNIQFRQYKRNELRFLVLISCFFFGMAHILNYEISWQNSFSFFFIFTPYFFSGVILSMLRLKFGLFYSILSHSIWNGVIWLIYFI